MALFTKIPFSRGFCIYGGISLAGNGGNVRSSSILRISEKKKKVVKIGLLICTLISQNQDLEKSRSASNFRKISGPAHLDFFFQVYGINLAFFLGGDLEKKSRFAGPEIFLRFEADLDFQKSRCRLKG